MSAHQEENAEHNRHRGKRIKAIYCAHLTFSEKEEEKRRKSKQKVRPAGSDGPASESSELCRTLAIALAAPLSHNNKEREAIRK